MLTSIALIAATVVAAPTGGRVTLEPDVQFGATQHWRQEGRAPASADVTLTIVLVPEDPEGHQKLEDTFWAVSDPKNPSYGEHLDVAAVKKLVHAAPSAVDAVTKWLLEEGKTTTSIKTGPHGDMLEVTLTVDKAEKLLEAELYTYTHTTRRPATTAIRCGEAGYTVPAHLSSFVALIEGVTRLPSLESGPRVVPPASASVSPSPSANAAAWPNDCGVALGTCGPDKVTPGVLTTRYNLPPAPIGLATTNGSTLAVAEFQGQVWDQKDLDKFHTTCKLGFNVTVDHESGAISPGKICQIPIFGVEACGEALLDIQYAKAIGGDIPLTDVYANNYNLLKWANDVAAMSPMVLVHSVSYGNDESQQTGIAYMNSANQAFMKLGSMGISVLFASGDQGVCGRTGCGFGKNVRYHPDFPAASPYITAVGGTDFLLRNAIGDETAWPDGGGGFSDTFPIPEYQKAAVATYKQTAKAAGVLPNAAYYNDTGRGYPDVAALAGEINPYCIAAGSLMMGIAGTSAASPVVAAIFARLNAIRLGKTTGNNKPLGFLNPFIYQHAHAFNDVTHGVNDEGGKGHGGFAATAGWDAATGVGTPDFGKLAALV